jgi:hypothetical protein
MEQHTTGVRGEGESLGRGEGQGLMLTVLMCCDWLDLATGDCPGGHGQIAQALAEATWCSRDCCCCSECGGGVLCFARCKSDRVCVQSMASAVGVGVLWSLSLPLTTCRAVLCCVLLLLQVPTAMQL